MYISDHYFISYLIIIEVKKIICLVHTNRYEIDYCRINLTFCYGCVVLDHANHVCSYLGPPLHCLNTTDTVKNTKQSMNQFFRCCKTTVIVAFRRYIYQKNDNVNSQLYLPDFYSYNVNLILKVQNLMLGPI